MLIRALLYGLMLCVGVATQASAQQNAPIGEALKGAFDTLRPILESMITRCTVDDRMYIVSAIMSPRNSSPITPQLVLEELPRTSSLTAYIQLVSWRLTAPELPLSDVDRRNGVDARFKIDFYAKAYRMYELWTHKWSEWKPKGPTDSYIRFAQYIIERKYGNWIWKEKVYMQPIGQTLQRVNCSEVPFN